MNSKSVRQPVKAEKLVEFLHALTLSALPEPVANLARRVVLDSIGCDLFGAGQVWTKAAVHNVSRDHCAGVAAPEQPCDDGENVAKFLRRASVSLSPADCKSITELIPGIERLKALETLTFLTSRCASN